MSKREFKNVHHFQRYNQESRGTNEKEWLLTPDNKLCLYKITQIKDDNTSTNAHYSECIYYEITKLIGVDCAKTELAKIQNKEGIISYYFLQENEELIDFNALIQNIRQDYIPKGMKCKYTKEYYSISLILEAIKSVVYNRQEYKKIRKKIMELIIMDSLCDHYDRNSSNIALIRNYSEEYDKQFKLAPIFDNGTSLAASLPIEVASYYVNKQNGLEELDDSIISKIGIGNRFASYKELLSYIFERYYDDCKDIVNNIQNNINEENLINIIFNNKYKGLDKYHKKLMFLKIMYNKNKILNLYKKYEPKKYKK